MIGGQARADAVARIAVAVARAGASLGLVELEHQGAVGEIIDAAEAVKVAHRVDPQPASFALIGQTRIEEAVAEHPLAAFERGEDGLVDMVRTGGGEQQSFGARIPARVVAFEQEFADRLGAGAPAGFSGDDDGQAAPGEGFGQGGELGRLADPFPAFEADEPTARHQPIPSNCLRPIQMRPKKPAGSTPCAAISGMTCSPESAVVTIRSAIWSPFLKPALSGPW